MASFTQSSREHNAEHLNQQRKSGKASKMRWHGAKESQPNGPSAGRTSKEERKIRAKVQKEREQGIISKITDSPIFLEHKMTGETGWEISWTRQQRPHLKEPSTTCKGVFVVSCR